MNVLNTPSPPGRTIQQAPRISASNISPATLNQSSPSASSRSYPSPRPSVSKASSPSPSSPNVARVRISPEEARRAESARVGSRLQGSLAVVLIWCIAKTFNISLTPTIEQFLVYTPVLATVYSFSRLCLLAGILYSFFSAAYFIFIGPRSDETGVSVEIPFETTYSPSSNIKDDASSSAINYMRVRSSPKTRPSPVAPSSPSLRSSVGNTSGSTPPRPYIPSSPLQHTSPDLRRTLLHGNLPESGQGSTILDAYRSRHSPVASPDLHRSFADKQLSSLNSSTNIKLSGS